LFRTLATCAEVIRRRVLSWRAIPQPGELLRVGSLAKPQARGFDPASQARSGNPGERPRQGPAHQGPRRGHEAGPPREISSA
jgi:hypothetical protein